MIIVHSSGLVACQLQVSHEWNGRVYVNNYPAPLFEYIDTFTIRKHGSEESIYVMIFRSSLLYHTTLRLRPRTGLFCTLRESSNKRHCKMNKQCSQ